MKAVKIALTTLGMGLLMASQTSFGASKKVASSSSGGSKSSARDWIISLPVMAERPQFRLHGEYNAAKSVGLAVELATIATGEELYEEEIQEKGNSLTINGLQASLLMSRYSDEANMGGFFWTLGAGYRRWGAEWKKQPGEKEVTRLGLVDQKGYLHHRVEGRGVTGHGRVGYRYVASEWPLAIGAHIGLRHMNSQVKDISVSDSEEQKLELEYSKLTAEESRSLKNRMMTTPDFSVDFGIVF